MKNMEIKFAGTVNGMYGVCIEGDDYESAKKLAMEMAKTQVIVREQALCQCHESRKEYDELGYPLEEDEEEEWEDEDDAWEDDDDNLDEYYDLIKTYLRAECFTDVVDLLHEVEEEWGEETAVDLLDTVLDGATDNEIRRIFAVLVSE